MKSFKTICLYFICILMYPAVVNSAPLNDFAVLRPESLTGNSGSYVLRHPDVRVGQSIDIGQKLLLKKISGDGEARLFISNSSEEFVVEGGGGDDELVYDCNGDGLLTVADLRLLLVHIQTSGPYDPKFDINKDGVVTVSDLRLLLVALTTTGGGATGATESNSNLPGVDIPNVRLIPDADVVATGTLIMDFDINQDLTSINHTGIGINLTQRDGEAFVMNALYNAPDGEEGEVHIDIYTDENRYSKCVIVLSEDTTSLDIHSSQAVVGVEFDDCVSKGASGGVDFSNVGAIAITLNATEVEGAQFLLTQFRTDSATLCNVEDCSNVIPDPSVPPSPSASPSASPSVSASSSSSPSVSPSSSASSSASSSPSVSPSTSASPSQPPNTCDLFRVDALQDSLGRWGTNASITDVDAKDWIEEIEGVPEASCVNSKLQDMIDYCKSTETRYYAPWNRRLMTKDFNDCMRYRAEIEFGFYPLPWTGFDNFKATTNFAEDYFEDKTYFVDSSCNPVPASAVDLADLCGEAKYVIATYTSPVSLILDSQYDIHSHVTTVSFPLDKEAEEGTVYEWKASSKSPLLVYDPEHTGQITTAEQLFGDWTFGGKKLDDGSTRKWKNGYEALAQLDVDKDGIIQEKELENLGLWFDKNQNGVSEPGEVIDVRKWGLSELYFQDYEEEVVSGDLSLAIGFKRESSVKGVTSGQTVDWYSKHFSPAAQSRSMLLRKFAVQEPRDNEFRKENSIGIGVSGVWKWTMQSEAGIDQRKLPQGILSLYSEGEKVEGISITDNAFDKDNAMVRSMLTLYPVTGEVGANGKISFQTQVSDDEFVYNEVRIDSDGRMHGKSARKMTHNNKDITIRYEWTAERM